MRAVLVVCLVTSVATAMWGMPLIDRLGGSEDGNCQSYCKTVGPLSQPGDVNCRGCPGAGKRPKGYPCEKSCGWTIPSSWKSMPGCAGCVAHDDSDSNDDSNDASDDGPVLGYARHTRDGDGEYQGCSLKKTWTKCDHDGACRWSNGRCENEEHHHGSSTRSQGTRHYGTPSRPTAVTNPSYNPSFPGMPSSLPGVPSSLPGAFGIPSSLPGVPSSLPGSFGFPSSFPGVPSSLPGMPSSLPGVPSSLPGVPHTHTHSHTHSHSYRTCTRHSLYEDCDSDGACAWTWFNGRSGGSCSEGHTGHGSNSNDWSFGGCASYCKNSYSGRAGWSHNPMCSGCSY